MPPMSLTQRPWPCMTGSTGTIAICILRWAGRTQPRCPWAEFFRSCGRLPQRFAESSRLINLHAGHDGVVHIVVALIVVIRSPDHFRIRLIGIYVDHPSEKMRPELSARSV